MKGLVYTSGFPLFLVAVVFTVLVGGGAWGSVGAGDGALYVEASNCAKSEFGRQAIKSCFHPHDTASLAPMVVLGMCAKVIGTGAPLRGAVRFFGLILGLWVLVLVWDLTDGRRHKIEGSVALWVMLASTPLVERARAGGVEVWLLLMLLWLAKLMAKARGSTWNTLAVLAVSFLLFATHPYAGCALLVCLLMPMVAGRPDQTNSSGGRAYFGWLGSKHLAGAVGGVAIFALVWPGFQGGPALWRRLVGLFREFHPPFRFGGEVWLQALDSGPPFYSTAGMVLLSTSVTAVVLILLGIFKGDRGGSDSLKPLLLLGLAWFTLNSLQGSPFADGYDHRLVLLGLFVPFAGRGFSVFEGCCAVLFPRQSWVWAMAVAAVVLGMSSNAVNTMRGRVPASGIAPDSGAMVGLGGSAFARPTIEPKLLEVLDSLPTHTRVACSPWEELCRTKLVPGLVALGLGGDGLRVARLFDADVVVIPNDPTYVTPPVLFRDLAAETHAVAEVYDGEWLRYAVKRLNPGAQGAPSSSLPR